MLGMSKDNGADTRYGRSSFRPRHWAQAQAENPLARFVPFSSLVSPHDVITRGGDYLRVWRLDGVAFECADEHQIGLKVPCRVDDLFASEAGQLTSRAVADLGADRFDRVVGLGKRRGDVHQNWFIRGFRDGCFWHLCIVSGWRSSSRPQRRH